MSDLPKGWMSVALEEAITPRSDRISPQEMPDAEFIGMEHVEPHTSRIVATVPASTMTSSAARFSVGNVLYGRMRPYLNKVVAPTFNGLASAEFIVFPQSDAIDTQFLLRRLTANDFMEFACRQYEGDRPRVKFDQLGKFDLRLPPRAEQTRIITKLEELLSDLDAGVAELKAAQKKLVQYRQSLLKAAVEGALTAEWRANNPHTETGVQLLERILQERRVRWEAKQLAKFKEQGKAPPKDWQKKYAEPVPPDATDLPELPHGWAWGSFDQLFEALSDNGKKLPQAAYAQAGLLPVIDQGAKFIGGYTDDVSLSFDGTLPVIGFGDHTRRFKLIENPFVVGADGLKLISISSAWIPEFAFIACSTLEFEDRGYSRHFQFVRNASFPLPPLGEQSEIVASVAARLKENDDISEAIVLALKQSAAQRQNILKAAFSGQLVAQDPCDEPASELLARIRAERAAQQAVKKPRGRKAKEAA